MKYLICALLIATERSDAFLFTIALLSGAASVAEGQLVTVFPAPWSAAVVIVSAALSLVSIALLVLKQVNIWKWLPPGYSGIDGLIDRLSTDIDLKGVAFEDPRGFTVIDISQAVDRLASTFEKVTFCGCDPVLAEAGGRINATGFADSVFRGSASAKAKRNLAISCRHPAAFALIDGLPFYRGLSSVIPLDRFHTTRYIDGKISDNKFDATMVPAPGQDVGCIVPFLIAKAQSTPEHRNNSVWKLLVEASICQVILIMMCAPPGQSEFDLVGANTSEKLGRLFRSLGFKVQPGLVSKDGQVMYRLRVKARRRKRGIRKLLKADPQLAAMLGLSASPVEPIAGS